MKKMSKIPEGVESGVREVSDYPYELPPDIAALGHSDLDPKTFDEALRGPNAKEWQEALDYEIKSLEPGLWKTYQLVKQQYHAVKS